MSTSRCRRKSKAPALHWLYYMTLMVRVSRYSSARGEAMTMVSKPGGGRFAFVDAGEAARILGIDRVTLDQWVRDGRIKPHRGVGRDSFYRTADLEALNKEMHPEAELAEAIAADERESAGEQVAT